MVTALGRLPVVALLDRRHRGLGGIARGRLADAGLLVVGLLR